MKPLAIVFLTCVFWVGATATAVDTVNGPDCSKGWPANMAFVHMKNAGIVTNDSIDDAKTTTRRLASQKIGKDLWHQVYLVTFTEKSGKQIQAIAIHDASNVECSMTGVRVFVVAQELNPEGK
jgi:hypothetical protein